MQIDLSCDQIHEYADRYDYDGDDVLGARMVAAEKRGHMTRDDLIAVARWKWRGSRTRQLCAENTEEEVKVITASSFGAKKSERLRIGALLSLRGVQWPMASVILHFAFPDRYPILDIRAMRTVGSTSHYTYEKWIEYVDLCRKTAAKCGVSMRKLDKALWAFDKGST